MSTFVNGTTRDPRGRVSMRHQISIIELSAAESEVSQMVNFDFWNSIFLVMACIIYEYLYFCCNQYRVKMFLKFTE